MMKLKKVIITLFCFAFFDIKGMSSMPFRIGFEGQMEGQLCMQALSRPAIQKRPIFEMHYDGTKLWHVEFDGPDLEFVTVPFSHNERTRLQACILTIQRAVDDLMTLLADNSVSTINSWFTSLKTSPKDKKVISDQDFFLTQNLGTIQVKKISADWEPVWRPQITIQHPLQSTIGIYSAIFDGTSNMEEIKKAVPEKIDPNTALGGLVFLQTHEMLGMTNSVHLAINDTRSNFALVTALTMYFIDKNISREEITLEEILKIIGDTAVVTITSQYYKNIVQLYQNASVLKMLIASKSADVERLISDPNIPKMITAFYDDRCAHITDILCKARDTNPILQDILFMMHTWQSLNEVNQFDAKRFTLFMSRRPFSHMLAEISTAANEQHFLTDNFSKKVLLDKNFVDIFSDSTASHLKRLEEIWRISNYGEQFYDIGNNPIDLTALVAFFPEPFKEQVKLLLKNGIISTTMLRIIDLEALKKAEMLHPITEEILILMRKQSYFQTALESVQAPKQKAFLRILKKEKIILDADQLPQSLDLISPPYPLDRHDAMGFHRVGVFSEDVDKFGSAIVELRNISDAKKFREKSEIGFLTNPPSVQKELICLFDFLNSLKVEAK